MLKCMNNNAHLIYIYLLIFDAFMEASNNYTKHSLRLQVRGM